MSQEINEQEQIEKPKSTRRGAVKKRQPPRRLKQAPKQKAATRRLPPRKMPPKKAKPYAAPAKARA